MQDASKGFETFLKDVLLGGGEVKRETGKDEIRKIIAEERKGMTEKTLAETIRKLFEIEKERDENPEKLDGRSISIARTKVEEAVLKFKQNKKPLPFGMREMKDGGSEIVSLALEAMLWIENSKKPEDLKNEIQRLSEIEVDPKEMLNYAVEGMIKAALGGILNDIEG